MEPAEWLLAAGIVAFAIAIGWVFLIANTDENDDDV